MSLKKQKGNMYDFVTHMWSPIKGKCSHDCSYCYMKRWGEQPPLHLDEKDLNTNLGSGNFIFVGHTVDMFAYDVPEQWVLNVLALCNNYNNKYLFQSKNPYGFNHYKMYFPESVILATTIETNRDIVNTKAPEVKQRAYWLGALSIWYETMVTIEPIFDFDLEPMIELIKTAHPTWVNIGADSKGHNLPEPSPEKIQQLIEALKKHTDVKLKGNLKRLYPQAKEKA